MKTTYSIDVEFDIHDGKSRGITEGLAKFEALCDRYKTKPILFVTGEVLHKHANVFVRLHTKGWEISAHGYSHKRFDDMVIEEKEEEIRKIVSLYKKLKLPVRGFRAPQHSIDAATLDLLEKYKFRYDSSYYPLNLFQLFFFPKRFSSWVKIFFSRINKYKIRKNVEELPTSSFIIPYVSLTVRALPKKLLQLYVEMIKKISKTPVFYAHSWDFIELKNSKIDRMFSHKKLLEKLEYLMRLENENTRTN